MGCIARLGCLVLLACLAIGGWLTRDRWLSKISGSPATSAESTWQPLTPAAGARGKRAIDDLAKPSGPVFSNLSASEVASYVFQSAAHTIPASADSAEAAVIGDVLYVRAVVPVKEVAGSGVLGPLAGLLNDRERLQLGGSFRVVRPGLSEFKIREIKLRDFKVPTGAIPRLVQQISHGERPEGIASDALPVTTPRSLADVRIANGHVTLYKTNAPATP
ncbi:MAG TPA: hypothetical protein VGP25_03030 [Gemmatimonadaceae bacterium]|jgi:hypothetical protein|nr:hypothetical protein [Gemmatimonadaceae bacterium]